MDVETIKNVLTSITEHVAEITEKLAVDVSGKSDPFKTLVSCVLSLRTREETTKDSSERLFRLVSGAKELANAPLKDIEKAIYPVGFWRTKAKNLQKISSILLESYDGNVPSTIDELLSLPGVGRKTANLVVSVAFDKPGICVDTHVHRIMNRLGFVDTSTPDQTERSLREKLPEEYWKTVNRILVLFGRNVCTPVSPRCSLCRVGECCEKIGVVSTR